MNDTKKCPYCGKEIMAVAKKCKHCGKWLSEKSEQNNHNYKETKSGILAEENPNKNKSFKALSIIIGIAVLALLAIGMLIITTTPTHNDSKEQSITISSMLYDLTRANTFTEKQEIVRKTASDEIKIESISHNIWDTWGSKEDCRLSTSNKAIYDEWCNTLKDPMYKCILENDTISAYGREYGKDLFIVRKGIVDGVYSIDLINENPALFPQTLKNRESAQELKELAKSLPYEEIMYGKKRGDIKLIYIPKDKYGKKQHLYTIKSTDTVPRPFYPPNGKNWEIVDYFWGERVSRIIFKNPEAEKTQQMEYWAYDCVDDEWDNKLEAPCLSITRDNTESVPKLVFTWKTSSGKNVSLTDYTYQSKYKIPKQDKNTIDGVEQKINLSLDLFQKLMNMKPTAVAQYLKQQGYKVEQCGEGVYEVKVKNGGITIYYPSYHSPRRGIGPVEFYTSDRNIYQQWVKSLQNADYTYFRDDIWIGDNAHKPEFGVMNNIGNKMDGADYSGTATLFLSAYPM